ncbi:hypothetical protein [Saccharomonospora marina]|uniref:hypothetical protein n=1 Tax=Saccharomonospora marina TaxID=632569 RepID=UPI0003102456|nr:hypothetical protein [Saccharomonospora marina]
MLTELDVWVHDTLGLANPLASHAYPQPDGMARHDQPIPSTWDLADAGADGPGVRAGREALRCPAVAELLDSVREPLTFERFGSNLGAAIGRTALRYHPDRGVARHCGGAG